MWTPVLCAGWWVRGLIFTIQQSNVKQPRNYNGNFQINFALFLSGAKDRDDEDEDWAEETTEEAQRRRMEEISDHAKNLTLSDDLEKPLEERVNLFYNFVKVSSFRPSVVLLAGDLQPLELNQKCSNSQQRKENATIDGAVKEILAEAERLDVKAMGPLILSELLFNENIREQIKKYKRHFLHVSLSSASEQRVHAGGLGLLLAC